MSYHDPYYKPKGGYGIHTKKARYGVNIKLDNGHTVHVDFSEPPTQEMIDKAKKDMVKFVNEAKRISSQQFLEENPSA